MRKSKPKGRYALSMRTLLLQGISMLDTEAAAGLFTSGQRRACGLSPAAPGDGHPIGGVKIVAASGWFAAPLSGTESISEIVAESFRGGEHLRGILEEGESIVNDALTAAPRGELGGAASDA
jgi:phosphoglucomutase